MRSWGMIYAKLCKPKEYTNILAVCLTTPTKAPRWRRRSHPPSLEAEMAMTSSAMSTTSVLLTFHSQIRNGRSSRRVILSTSNCGSGDRSTPTKPSMASR
jgi:hypothetical protein